MKKLLFLLCCLLILCFFSFTAFSVSYDDTYPDYLEIRGLVYVQVNSSLGQGSFIFSPAVKNNTLSFGRGTDFYNCTGSNISGIFISSNGTQFSVRLSAFDSPEYRLDSGFQSQYVDIDVYSVISTNVDFIDYSDGDTQNDNYYLSKFEKLIVVLLCFLIFFNAFVVFLLFRRRD